MPGLIESLCTFHRWGERKNDLNDIQTIQVTTHPWFLILWEPLHTKAPNPTITRPYCCYSNTVIFYLRPYVIRPFSKLYGGPRNWRVNSANGGKTRGIEYEIWDRTEHKLRCDDLIRFNGEDYKLGCGTVVWSNKRWWMRHWARRVQPK